MKKIYIAVRNRKNGKPEFSYGIADDPGEIFRNLSEMDELKNFNVGEFEINQVGLIKNSDSDYWSTDEEECE